MEAALAHRFDPILNSWTPWGGFADQRVQTESRAKEWPVEPTREQAYKRRIAELERGLAAVRAELAAALSEVARLSEQVAKLSKNSSNSSKPPSSDIVKPPTRASSKKPNRGNKKRKIGGQPGHPKHDRKLFEEGEVNQFWEYHMDRCPDCGSSLKPSQVDPRIVQQIEIAEAPVRIEEHRALGFYCAKCGSRKLETRNWKLEGKDRRFLNSL